jgi:acetyl-CoA carboxylase biotin carboxyl carrier protein
MAAKRAQKRGRSAPGQGKHVAAGGPDKVGQIQRLIEVMIEAGAVEVEMEEAGSKIRVRLKEDRPTVYAASAPMAMAAPVAAAGAAEAGAAGSAAKEPAGEVFKSPMLGTFYRAASPEAEAFVKPGDRVGADTTLCIIEAMKVMNEIKAEREFEILEVLVRNGDPVEFGQPLFVIRS